jgi:signal transduction histidine kinase
MAFTAPAPPIAICLSLTSAMSRARTLEDIYQAALDALAQGLGVVRASILLFDADGVMRFKASRGLSKAYQTAVEGHTPWRPDTPDPQPIVVSDVVRDPSLQPYLEVIAAEGIAGMTFIPLVCQGRVIGKFMLYSELRREFTADQLQLAGVIAAQVAFAVVRARAEAAAEEANRLKDEFLATLSHELRTPLNAIVGWVRMLQDRTLSPERVSHAIDVIGRNANLQTQLIADILDVTRIAAGKLDIERRPLLVPRLVDSVITSVIPAAQAKRITLLRRMPQRAPRTQGDHKRLHQVLGNIMSNAIKFTPEHGVVRISCDVDASSLTILVRDSGAGIAADFLPFVFERFRQADSPSARRHEGLGLGLAIARHLVELHGGQIRAQSDGPGRGSTFSVRLPLYVRPRASRRRFQGAA